MSVLETFLILFESNSADVVKAQGQAAASAEKTAASMEHVGVAAESAEEKIRESGRIGAFEMNELDRVVKRFGTDFIRQTAEWATGLLGFLAVEKLVESFMQTSEQVEHLGNVAKQLGANVEDVDAWGQMVKKAGGDTERFDQSLFGLQRRLALLSTAGPKGNATDKLLNQLGIDPKSAKSAIDLLPQLADAFHGMDAAHATGVGEALRLDPTTIMLLRQGRVAVDEQIEAQKRLGVVTQENVEINEKFQIALKNVEQLARGDMLDALDLILPALTMLLDVFTETVDFLRSHQAFAEGFFTSLATIVLVRYVPAMIEAAVATVAATWPILLTAAAVLLLSAAFGLVYDDIQNFREGNNSVIGELIKRWPVIGAIFKDIGAAVEALWDIFKSFSQYIVALGVLLIGLFINPQAAIANFQKIVGIAWKSLGDAFNVLSARFPFLNTAIQETEKFFVAAGNEILKIWNEVIATIEDAVKKVGGAISTVEGAVTHPGQTITNVAKSSYNGISDFYHHLMNDPDGSVSKNIATAQGHINALPSLAPVPGSATSNAAALAPHQGAAAKTSAINVNVTGTTINVQGSGADPKAVADQVNKTLSDHITHTINHYADGVSG